LEGQICPEVSELENQVLTGVDVLSTVPGREWPENLSSQKAGANLCGFQSVSLQSLRTASFFVGDQIFGPSHCRTNSRYYNQCSSTIHIICVRAKHQKWCTELYHSDEYSTDQEQWHKLLAGKSWPTPIIILLWASVGLMNKPLPVHKLSKQWVLVTLEVLLSTLKVWYHHSRVCKVSIV